MGDFTFDTGLSPWLAEQAARHAEMTYHLNYGALDKITENYFREPPGSVVTQAPPAAALRELIAAFRSGKPVRLRLTGFSKQDKYRLSEMLRQSAARAYRDDQQELGQALIRLSREFDAEYRLTDDELTRHEHLGFDASQREAQLARAEASRLKRSRVA